MTTFQVKKNHLIRPFGKKNYVGMIFSLMDGT